MKRNPVADIIKLSVAERIQFVEDVWDSIANVPEALSLTEAQKKELDERLKNYHRNPNAGSPWKKIKQRLYSKNAI